METLTQTITKEEALRQGYMLCGYSKETQWQHLLKITDLDEEDFKIGELVLANKEFESPTTDANKIKELICDVMESNWGNDTGDESEHIFKAFEKLDFAPTAEMINKALAHIKSYTLTDIVLINK